MSAIAIVGMGCRFGHAPDLHAYWKLMLEGRDAFTPIPPDRWNHELFYDPRPRATDKSYAPAAAFIEDIRTFPALALGLPPRRVEVMDPQQRMTIELAVQAIEDSGRRPGDLPDNTGVFVGLSVVEYRILQASRVIAHLMADGSLGRAPEDLTGIAEAVQRVVPSRPYSAPGALGNMSAAAVAQELDLKGPAFTVDAACTSSLIALTEAVRNLRTGAVEAALVGGAYISLTPEHHIAFTRIGAMSSSGHCLPFDHKADGFVQGDGVGMILLKRLEDAERDGDRIYAVIDAVATNNDGKGTGPMAPVLSGQVDVIRRAWEASSLDPSDLGYIETHGTGTSVGDQTEFKALMEALGDKVSQVVLGSAKANVGHTMSAAGVAGVIRAALAIHHKIIPPMAGFERAKPEMGYEEGAPFVISAEAQEWKDPSRRVAGVSSFGFGGTNAHALLTEAPEPRLPEDRPHLICLSAPTKELLEDLAARTAEAIRIDPSVTPAGVARAWSRRSVGATRLSLVASSREELIDKLESVGQGKLQPGMALGSPDRDVDPKIAFLFPGQGAQRVNLLRDSVRRFPILWDTLLELEAELEGLLPVPLTQLIYPELREDEVSEEEAEALLRDTANTQPAMLAASLALHRLLEQVGVHPDVTTGHSLGEFTAAVVAGVISAGDAARFVSRRGRAMAEIEGDHGAMCALMVEEDQARALLVGDAILANLNHPRQFVASGRTEEIEQIIARAEAADVKAVRLNVSHGFHSPVLGDLDSAPLLEGVELHDPQLPLISAIARRPYRDAADAYDIFSRHAVTAVDFMTALRECQEAGATLFLQVGAGGPLAAFARGTLRGARKGILTLGGREDDDGGATILASLGRLWTLGVDVDLEPITDAAPVASVPPAILPREYYWAIKDRPQASLELEGVAPRAEAHPEVEEAPVEAPSPEGGDETARVLQVIAKVSAYPVDALRLEMALIEDLGFDSLMVGDLATGLADAFPGLPGIPQELLINRPTVQDIVDHVVHSAAAGEEASDDDAPLASWRPVWRPAPLPSIQPRSLPDKGSVLITGHPGAWAEPLRAALDAAGMQIHFHQAPGPVDLVIHVALDEPLPVGAVLAGEAEWPDLVEELLPVLQAVAEDEPDLIILRPAAGPWAEALSGAARSLAREWPESVVKIISVDGEAEHLGARVLSEWSSADQSVDVLYRRGVRHLIGLEPCAPSPTPWQPQAGDKAVITGGCGGIGARLAERLVGAGVQVVLVDLADPGELASRLISEGQAVHVRVDVTDGDALTAALAPHAPIRALIHAAGVLADGPVQDVPVERGRLARAVKVAGWLNALVACGPSLEVALGMGSITGHFGNRHQVHYAAANALLSALSEHVPAQVRGVVGSFGPWSSSEMVRTIPAPVQAAMRASGVDFVGDAAGMDALWADLVEGVGPRIKGRDLPPILRTVVWEQTLSVDSHPYLADHAIEGVPVLPMAEACDLMASAAGVAPPFQVDGLTVYQGVAVKGPTPLITSVHNDQVELRVGERRALAYRARVRPAHDLPEIPDLPTGGQAPALDRDAFYERVTFHGPLLQGIVALDGYTPEFVRGRVRTGTPSEWIPGSSRRAFSVDPLAFDSAMQLSAWVAWERFHRAGLPVGLGRLVQLAPLPEGELLAEVHTGQSDADRFSGTLVLRDLDGTPLMVVEELVAELAQVEESEPATPEAPAAPEPDFEVKDEWVDPTSWPAYRDLEMRLAGAQAMGLDNPYFAVHEGTARDTTLVAGREMLNYSTYNYLGLSGDPRTIEAITEAMRRYGTSVSASRVASGERPFHAELERELAACQGSEDALVFTAGHATNMSAIGTLMGPEDVVFHDELIHDSILQGIKLSGAARRSFRHDDPEHLAAELARVRPHFKKALITVEGVYSMDGDICNLPAFIELKKRWGAMILVDEAHSFGIIGATGQGCREHFDIDGSEVDLWMGTLSKSLSSCGGWLAGSSAMIKYLKYAAGGFVYSAGITPANGVAALSSLRLMLAEPWRVEKLQRNARTFYEACVERGLDTGPSVGQSGVVPVITGNSLQALFLAQRLKDQGVNVQPIVYPAVAEDAARLRFFLSSTHSEEQLVRTAQMIADTLAGVRRDLAL